MPILPTRTTSPVLASTSVTHQPAPAAVRGHRREDGCTAVTAVLIGATKLIVANVGDSRAVLCRNGQGARAAPRASRRGARGLPPGSCARRGGRPQHDAAAACSLAWLVLGPGRGW